MVFVAEGAQVGGDFDLQADLLFDFAEQGLFQGFAVVGKAAGEAPVPFAGLASPAHQEDAVVAFDDAGHAGGRVVKVLEAAGAAAQRLGLVVGDVAAGAARAVGEAGEFQHVVHLAKLHRSAIILRMLSVWEVRECFYGRDRLYGLK